MIKHPNKEDWQKIVKRPVFENTSLEKTVKKVLEKVKAKGDQAVRIYTKEFDGVKLKKLAVSEKEIKAAENLLPQELKAAIQQARSNIEKFHRSQ
ncbi:MAG TPA: histidinol dehydrogenase, partial [Chitinophagaceae bacterium]